MALQQATATLDKMQYIEGRTFTKEEIFGVFAPGPDPQRWPGSAWTT